MSPLIPDDRVNRLAAIVNGHGVCGLAYICVQRMTTKSVLQQVVRRMSCLGKGKTNGTGRVPDAVATVDSQPFGNREEELPVGDRGQIVWAVVSAVIRVRFWWQLGRRQRCWQEKATNISWRQSGQRTRAKPKCRSPQRRNRRATSPMIGRRGPYCFAYRR